MRERAETAEDLFHITDVTLAADVVRFCASSAVATLKSPRVIASAKSLTEAESFPTINKFLLIL